MNQIVLTGMVLSTMPIGEYDRRVVILTKEQGKISAFARGARRPNSPLVGVVNPFSFGEFTMYEGRSSFTIQSVNISNYFAELREDMLAAYYGFYFLEVADYFTKEANDEKEMLKLLYQTLRALINPHISNKLIKCIYELKTLTINGQAPQVFQCVLCGKKEHLSAFSALKGGEVCRACMGNCPDTILLNDSTIYSMQYIESSTIEKLYTFAVTDKVLDELEKVTERLRAIYIDRNFKSLEILDTLL